MKYFSSTLLPIASSLLVLANSLSLSSAFVMRNVRRTCHLTTPPSSLTFSKTITSSSLPSSSSRMFAAQEAETELLSLELEKPLGIILEEVEEGQAMGVKVEELSDSGSAYAYKDQILGCKVAQVMSQDVTAMSFDSVMELLIDAPSPLSIAFEVDVAQAAETDEDAEPVVTFDVGTPVTMTVVQEGNPTREITTKVGDNMRKALLENKVELYRGLKKKLGNCGGAGQCTFCAVDFVEGEGWEERSEYEDKKLPKYPTARLSCQSIIQGPCTIRVE